MWGCPEMVVPNNHGFPTKNDHFGVFWGYHHLRKHTDVYRTMHDVIFKNPQWETQDKTLHQEAISNDDKAFNLYFLTVFFQVLPPVTNIFQLFKQEKPTWRAGFWLEKKNNGTNPVRKRHDQRDRNTVFVRFPRRKTIITNHQPEFRVTLGPRQKPSLTFQDIVVVQWRDPYLMIYYNPHITW